MIRNAIKQRGAKQTACGANYPGAQTQNVALVMHLLHRAAVNICGESERGVFVICSAFHAVCSRINQPIVILIVSHNRLCMRHKSKLQSTHKYENTTGASGRPAGRAGERCLIACYFSHCALLLVVYLATM